MKHYRLPDGTITKSNIVYQDTWYAIAAHIENLTGSKLVGFNPDLAFCRNDINSSYWTLPPDIAILIVNALNSK